MIINTPYIEVFLKKSFLSGNPEYGSDETIFAVLAGIRFIRGRAPLFVAYIPELGAMYDKIDQCSIFNRPNPPETAIMNSDVAWWDSISDNWQLMQFELLKGWDIEGVMAGSIDKMIGTYLFTCEPLPPSGVVDYGQSTVWHEHKTKTFAFDEETGVLFCVPNNKMRAYDMSLTPAELGDPIWLKVYKDTDSPERVSHESNNKWYGDTDQFTYDSNN